jgi:hypothetical protein
MPVKHYGIYLAYPPTVDLRAEGLGRNLAMFLKGAQALPDVRFTIVCPSWTRETLQALFESEQVPSDVFDIVAPPGKPYALRLFVAMRAYRTRPRRPGRLARARQALQQGARDILGRLTAMAVAVHGPLSMAALVSMALALLLVVAPFALLGLLAWLLVRTGRLAARIMWRLARLGQRKLFGKAAKVSAVLAAPQKESWVLRLFDEMNRNEARRMQRSIDRLAAVRAWYCPTAFWPNFNAIQAPRLMCVPDVVLSDFPAGFAKVGGERFLATFEGIGRAICGAGEFVTYSQTVQWNTLVDR